MRQRLRATGTLIDKAPGGSPAHGVLAWETRAILDLAERWGEADRSHRKLAHRGSYTETVWVFVLTVRRVREAQGFVLPERGPREPVGRHPWPGWLVWAPNRISDWDVTHFSRARRCAFAIIDMVSRKWIDTLVSVEETSTQVKVIFEQVLTTEGLVDLLTPEHLELPADDPQASDPARGL